MSALGCILGATSLLFAAFGSRERDDQTERATKAICAVQSYAKDTLKDVSPQARVTNPKGIRRFDRLVKDLETTGVKCGGG